MDYFFIHNIPVCIDSSSIVNLVVNYSSLDFNSIIKNKNDSNKVHISWNTQSTAMSLTPTVPSRRNGPRAQE